MAAEESPSIDRSRVRFERGRRRRRPRRQETLQRSAGEREGLSELPARSEEQRRPQLAARERQRDLSPRRRLAAPRRVRLPGQPQRSHAGLFRARLEARIGRDGGGDEGRDSESAGRQVTRLSRKYSRLQRDNADDLRGDYARSGPRRKRTAANGARNGQLPHPPDRDSGTDT